MSSPITPKPPRIDLPYHYKPEPKGSGLIKKLFGDVFDLIKGAGSQVMGGANGGVYMDLIQEQMRQQQQMQLVSMISNTEKSKHETSMVPLRNLSVR